MIRLALAGASLIALGASCGDEKSAAPPGGAADPGAGEAIEVPADLELPSDAEIEDQAREAVTEETADEVFERLKREIEEDS